MEINGTFLTQKLIERLTIHTKSNLEEAIKEWELLLSLVDQWNAMTPKQQEKAWEEASNDDTQDLFE